MPGHFEHTAAGKITIPDFAGRFTLREEYFDHRSHLHGIEHTCRVMTHCIILGAAVNLGQEAKAAFCGAFIHDMARQHDGNCFDHGRWAAERKLPMFAYLFRSIGVGESALEAVRTAVEWHSLPMEIDRGHDFNTTVAILKDADALDRIRLSSAGLDPGYLRFPESRGLISYAERLYKATHGRGQTGFTDFLALAIGILSEAGMSSPGS